MISAHRNPAEYYINSYFVTSQISNELSLSMGIDKNQQDRIT